MEQKTILILTIQFGAGHRRVAEAVAKTCEKNFPQWKATVVDVTPCMPYWIRWIYVDLYLLVLKYVPSLWRWIEGVQRKQSHTFPPRLLESTADRLQSGSPATVRAGWLTAWAGLRQRKEIT